MTHSQIIQLMALFGQTNGSEFLGVLKGAWRNCTVSSKRKEVSVQASPKTSLAPLT